jgi:hypothetical protein
MVVGAGIRPVVRAHDPCRIVAFYVDHCEPVSLPGRSSISIRAPAAHSISSWDDTLPPQAGPTHRRPRRRPQCALPPAWRATCLSRRTSQSGWAHWHHVAHSISRITSSKPSIPIT